MNYRVVWGYVRREIVLCIAILLGILSCFLVPPDVDYLSYVDYRTLALLFSLMTVMAGFQQQGVFYNLGKKLLARAKGMTQIVLVLVLLCFFTSMLITNDVALITFVPFAFVVLDMLGPNTKRAWILQVVCMQTIAANLGSMFTPIGNPQNLYLYGKSGMDFFDFLLLMFPYTAVSLGLLILWILMLCKKKAKEVQEDADLKMQPANEGNMRKILLYLLLFALCLLSVAHVLPYPILFFGVIGFVLCFDRAILLQVDYSLLFTFVGFFVFIGNLGRLPLFSEWLCGLLAGREVPVAVLASQVISNVPAALLLSGFTDKIPDLVVGTNLGGLGTLIASMASLISFRQIANGEPDRKGRYFVLFTISNVIFLMLLLGLWVIK